MPQLAHAARKGSSYEELTAPEAAWLCRVRQLAEVMQVKSFSEMAFASAFGQLKTMLRDTDAVRQVPAVLATAGVRFLIVETLPSTRIDGVCLWLNPDAPVIALSLRYDRIDAFWHTLLHECAHVKYKDGLTEDIVDFDLVGDEADSSIAKPEAELKADQFASGFSIPKAELDGFIARVRPLFSKTRIQAFAAKLNVHPGLVVGQLQYRKMIPYSHSREMLARVRPILTEVALTDGFGSILSNAH
jgi:HTH-type transcriptional regulator/antitoxin HigA